MLAESFRMRWFGESIIQGKQAKTIIFVENQADPMVLAGDMTKKSE